MFVFLKQKIDNSDWDELVIILKIQTSSGIAGTCQLSQQYGTKNILLVDIKEDSEKKTLHKLHKN